MLLHRNNILSHAVFEGVTDAQPLKIGEGAGMQSGVQSVFDIAEYKTAMAERGNYKAACNSFDVDPVFTPLPGVPVRKSSVPLLKDY